MVAFRAALVALLGGVAWVVPVTPAGAQAVLPGYSADVTTPSDRGSDWFYLDSLDVRGHGRMAVGVVTTYAYDAVVAHTAAGRAVAVVREQAVLHAGASFVLGERTRLSFDAPMQFAANGTRADVAGATLRAPRDAVTPGDMRLGGDVRLFGRYGEGASAAVGLQLFVPAGDPASYTGDGEPRARPRVSFAYNRRVFAFAAMAGLHVRGRAERWGEGRVGSEGFVGFAAGARLAHGLLLVGPELLASTVLAAPFGHQTTSVEALLEARLDIVARLRVALGGGTSLVQGYGSPGLRVLFAIEWVPDTPPEPEPEPSDRPPDRDGDGVPDCEDACGFIPGDASELPSQSGCPPRPSTNEPEHEHDEARTPATTPPGDQGSSDDENHATMVAP